LDNTLKNSALIDTPRGASAGIHDCAKETVYVLFLSTDNEVFIP